MSPSKKTKEEELANAKLYYQNLIASKGSPSGKSARGVKKQAKSSPMSSTSKKKKAPELTKRTTRRVSFHGRSPVTIPAAKVAGGKKSGSPSPLFISPASKKPTQAECDKALKFYNELERKMGTELPNRLALQDDEDDVPLIMHEGAKVSNRSTFDRGSVFDSIPPMERSVSLDASDNTMPTSGPATMFANAKSILTEGHQIHLWGLGLASLMLAFILEDTSTTKVIEVVINPIRAIISWCTWMLFSATLILVGSLSCIWLTTWTVHQARTIYRQKQIQFRRDVLGVKMRVFEVLQLDPDTGVTVSNLHDEIMISNMKNRCNMRKVWSKVVTEIHQDNRVAKLSIWVEHSGIEEEVWQWTAGQKDVDSSRFSRVMTSY